MKIATAARNLAPATVDKVTPRSAPTLSPTKTVAQAKDAFESGPMRNLGGNYQAPAVPAGGSHVIPGVTVRAPPEGTTPGQTAAKNRLAGSTAGDLVHLSDFDKNARLLELINPRAPFADKGPGPGHGDPMTLITNATAIPTPDSMKNKTDKNGNQSDGTENATTVGTFLSLLGAVGSSGPGKVGLEVLVGAGTRPELAGAAGALVASALLGAKIGTAIDQAITDHYGKSLGDMAYDRLHPDTPAVVTAKPDPLDGGNLDGGNAKMPDPTGDGGPVRGAPPLVTGDSKLPSIAEQLANRRRQTSMPTDAGGKPERMRADLREALAQGVRAHTDNRINPGPDGGPGTQAPGTGAVDPKLGSGTERVDGGRGPKHPDEG